jgi:hypothetical protein
MMKRERLAVKAVISLTGQFLQSRDEEWIDSRAMSAGEDAILALGEYGLMTVKEDGRLFGKWNREALRAFESE